MAAQTEVNMEERRYPKLELIKVTTSTAVNCCKCSGGTRPYEVLWQTTDGYYHDRCKPDPDAKPPMVKTVVIKDRLSVKSQGK